MYVWPYSTSQFQSGLANNKCRGIGNLVCMPFAIGVGRRIVFLGSILVLALGAALCATAKSYEWHLASRMVVGLAAGQSEALVPMITQVYSIVEQYPQTLIAPRRSSSCTNAAKPLWANKRFR